MRDFQKPGRSTVYATAPMAATSMPQATLAAVEAMRAGGNALDAAVTAAAVLAVIEPQSTGIGGDCFCLYKPAGGEVIALNGSGRTAGAASLAALQAAGLHELSPTSPHVVTIPGAVSAWATLLASHGRRGLDAALAPAIAYAEDGYAVAPRVAFDWTMTVEKLRATGADLLLPHGQAPFKSIGY